MIIFFKMLFNAQLVIFLSRSDPHSKVNSGFPVGLLVPRSQSSIPSFQKSIYISVKPGLLVRDQFDMFSLGGIFNTELWWCIAQCLRDPT